MPKIPTAPAAPCGDRESKRCGSDPICFQTANVCFRSGCTSFVDASEPLKTMMPAVSSRSSALFGGGDRRDGVQILPNIVKKTEVLFEGRELIEVKGDDGLEPSKSRILLLLTH